MYILHRRDSAEAISDSCHVSVNVAVFFLTVKSNNQVDPRFRICPLVVLNWREKMRTKPLLIIHLRTAIKALYSWKNGKMRLQLVEEKACIRKNLSLHASNSRDII